MLATIQKIGAPASRKPPAVDSAHAMTMTGASAKTSRSVMLGQRYIQCLLDTRMGVSPSWSGKGSLRGLAAGRAGGADAAGVDGEDGGEAVGVGAGGSAPADAGSGESDRLVGSGG